VGLILIFIFKPALMADFAEAKEYYEQVTKTYWQRYRELQELERAMAKARTEMETACKHDWVRDWEDRDERSRWICRHCNKSR